LVRGDQDIFISRESISKLAALISDAHILNIPFAGHAVYEQQKEILLHSLKQFLQYN
jgi:pimeloyl-ACP methyl ester carboxylesterase